MARTFDISAARANIREAIQNTSAQLTQLQATEKLIDTLGDNASEAVEALIKFGRVKAEEAPAPLDSTGLTDTAAITQAVLNSAEPVRANAVIARLADRDLKPTSVNAVLSDLAQAKTIRRMSQGLYWKPAEARANGKPVDKEAILDVIKEVLQEAKKPLRMKELHPAVAKKMPLKGKHPKMTISRAIKKLGKKVIQHHGGIGPYHAYSLK